jgi:hypothetical protein
MQGSLKLLQLSGVQSCFATGASSFPESFGALRLPQCIPTSSRLGADAQASGDVGFAQTASKKFGRAKAALLQLVEVTLQSFEMFHTTFDTSILKTFTILYRTQ